MKGQRVLGTSPLRGYSPLTQHSERLKTPLFDFDQKTKLIDYICICFYCFFAFIVRKLSNFGLFCLLGRKNVVFCKIISLFMLKC